MPPGHSQKNLKISEKRACNAQALMLLLNHRKGETVEPKAGQVHEGSGLLKKKKLTKPNSTEKFC